MAKLALKRGRPGRHVAYDQLLASLRDQPGRRPRYVNRIGVLRGKRGDTIWVKIQLRHAAVFKGRHIQAGAHVEIKLGRRESWAWGEAEAARDQLQGRADRGEALEEAVAITFARWAEQWLPTIERQRSAATVKLHLRKHLVPAFGQRPLDALTGVEIEAWQNRRLAVVAPATVHREIATLSVMLSAAVRARHIAVNPCQVLPAIRGIVGRQRYLQGDEIARLLAAASRHGQRFHDFLLWCLHSGMRRSEVLALSWNDLRTLPDGRLTVLIPTSKADRPRIVHCDGAMTEIVLRQGFKDADPARKVFPFVPITLRRKWDRIREEAGLPDVTLHDLRRTHATIAVAAGVDLRTLAGRLGHSNLSMLHKHYAAIIGDNAKAAAERTGREISSWIAAGQSSQTRDVEDGIVRAELPAKAARA